MPQTITDLLITPDAWVDVFTATGISPTSPIIAQNKSGQTHIDYVISATQPTVDYSSVGMIPRYQDLPQGITIYTYGLKLWMKTDNSNVLVSIFDATSLLTLSGGFPDGVFTGERAINKHKVKAPL